MTNQNIEISLLKESEIEEVKNFFNFITNGYRDKEKFNWEFKDAPAGKAIYVIAKDVITQKIIGTQCAIPIELITDSGNTILSAKSEDSIVHPDYRGMNIFEKMYQYLFIKCIEQDIKYLWGFTSAKKPFLKLGFEIPFDQSQSLMVLNIISSYNYLSKLNSKNNFLSLSKILSLCIISKINTSKNIFISTSEIDNDFSFQEVKSPLNIDTPFIQQNNKGFMIKQDFPFFNWRIEKNPYHEEIFNINFFQDELLVANLLFNHHLNGVWYLISDTYSNKISEIQKIKLHKKAIKLLIKKHKTNLKLIRTWDFSHNDYAKKELENRAKLGYFHLDRGISFVWKSLNENSELDVMNFNLSRIATQGVI